MKISVSMIVKNEESCLENCLKTLTGFDEIVICDTGSTDKTVEIAKRYTDKVFTDYKWEDSFAKARNHAYQKCTGDWVFTIDADNILLEGSLEGMRKAIADRPEAFAMGVTFRAVNNSCDHQLPYLYRKCPEVFWLGAAHNYLSKRAQYPSGATIVYGYSAAHKKDPNRTLRILLKEVMADRKKPREIFYLAREYKYRKDYIGALYWYDEYLKLGRWAPEVADALLMKAQCLWRLFRGAEARAACLKAIRINPEFKEAYLLMATLQPKCREHWLMVSEIAKNTDVLFKRQRTEETEHFYEKLTDNDLSRYKAIYEKIQKLAGKRSFILDIGCGKTAPLAKYFDNYDGFDFIVNPVREGNAYDHGQYLDVVDEVYDVYLAIEVLEHLDDVAVLRNIPAGSRVIFSVPSFYCDGHVRVYTRDIIAWRFRHLLEIESATRFNWKGQTWVEGGEETPQYITLCTATKKKEATDEVEAERS